MKPRSNIPLIIARSIVAEMIEVGTLTGDLLAVNTITADRLATDSIRSSNYEPGAVFSVAGSFLDLETGTFHTPGVYIDGATGLVRVRGELTATSLVVLRPDTTATALTLSDVVFKGNAANALEFKTDAATPDPIDSSILAGFDSDTARFLQLRSGSTDADRTAEMLATTNNVEAGVSMTARRTPDTVAQVAAFDSSTAFGGSRVSVAADVFKVDSKDDTIIKTNFVERMRVRYNGAVTFNKPTPFVNDDDTGIVLGGAGASAGLFNSRMRGTNNANLWLDRSGEISPNNGQPFILFRRLVNSTIGSVSIATTGSVAFNTTSDERRKESLGPIPDALTVIERLTPRRFRWLDLPDDTEPGRPDIGFFAQEVVEHVPEAVTVGGLDPITEPWQLDQSRLVPHLVAAIQELAAEVGALRSRVAQLESAR